MSTEKPSIRRLIDERGAPDVRERPPLPLAVVMLVRQRIATGFYDSPPVRRAMAESVLDCEIRGGGERR
jgi:hypothetical protein